MWGNAQAMIVMATIRLRRLSSSDRGASVIEYTFLVALITIVCVAAVTFMGEETSSKFASVGGSVSVAGPGS